ncbi:MAG: extracellular solute-binding protein [Lachnoclostridium sp.]|jgi:ABC-type glycerol-3-phosphate transport system substrate-binding protein|nr:extracellular solute-binding protein [Lachnoclostridium sp.]
MSKLKSKKIIVPLILLLVIGGLVVWTNMSSGVSNYREKYEGTDLQLSETELGRRDTYSQYLLKEEHVDAESPDDIVPISLFEYDKGSQGIKKEAIGGEAETLRMEEDGKVEWTVNVKAAGYYNVYLEYYPLPGRGVDIERSFLVNGKVPFRGADALTFSRVFVDADKIKTDNQGNQIRPTQVEGPSWQSVYLNDATGFETEPYKFFFNQGKNTVSFVGINEPFAIRKLEISNQNEILPYAEYEKENQAAFSKKPSKNTVVKVQAETAQRRSTPSLYASFDRGSGNTEPEALKKVVFNMSGGKQWRVAGDWIEIDFEVPEDGAYVFSLKGRQGYNRGFVAMRKIMIDGRVPFLEASQLRYEFSSTWDMHVLQNEGGTPYRIPLTKGKHTLRMEVTLGEFGNFLSELNDRVYNMNQMYRKILVITGSAPDIYRDYHLEEALPEVVEQMGLEAKRLYKIVDEVVAYTGTTNQHLAVAGTLASQLEDFHEDPTEIPQKLTNFKTNISSLGTSINTLRETAMDVDYICFADEVTSLPKVNETGFDRAIREAQMFGNSFFSDSNRLGNIYEGQEALDVWIVAGRDQSSILKTMIDDTFTPQTGIAVNVKLIDVLTLLPAAVAGTGPDVALTVAQTEPVNYALRNASEDLMQFGPELKEVLKEYPESAYEAFKFNGGLYGLPETQNYNVLFYRTDICEELGITPPETWDDVIKMLPVLQRNNMQFAVPSIERKIGTTINPDLANYYAQLYQRGGRLYNEDHSKTTISSDMGIEAFEFYTKLFTNYKLELQYDFLNRFRSGEMPIGVADYSNYNTFAVFAPEIDGLWEFDMVPGMENPETGEIDRSIQSWGTASMMLKPADQKENSWEFLKWWAHSDTQVRFGRELESVMGKSARYATANTVAFERMSWGVKEANILREQWKWAFSLPEVAGGYYTPRHVTNAIRKVINDRDDPRETLLDYAKTIDDELENKRKEFTFDITGTGPLDYENWKPIDMNTRERGE